MAAIPTKVSLSLQKTELDCHCQYPVTTICVVLAVGREDISVEPRSKASLREGTFTSLPVLVVGNGAVHCIHCT